MALLTGSQCSNWGNLASRPEALAQVESQGWCWCEVADESVVVSKAWPVKPSNGVEGKTKLTNSNASVGVPITQKR
ncbi:hypothetical protein ETN89_04680 [Photobacterium damselae subsp. damselae]|nr:hypothetical protein ETN89_04680 [Photobacterium damselae subsp. damselae]